MKKEFSKQQEKYFYLYPLFHYVELLAFAVGLIVSPGILGFLGLFFALYLQSPLLAAWLRNHYEEPKTLSYFGKKAEKGNLWFAYYQLQNLYNTFPALEKVLIALPEGYSSWLRLWGSQVGEKVNWTPGCMIVDRTHMIIGSRCLIGNLSYLSAHAIKKKDGKYLLFIKNVTIGDDTVLAFRATLGPGVVVGNNCFVEAGAVLYPKDKVENGENYERFEELSKKRFDPLFTRNG